MRPRASRTSIWSKIDVESKSGSRRERARVGRWHLGRVLPHTLRPERVRSTERGVHRQDLRVADPSDRPRLGDPGPLGGQGHRQVEHRMGRGVREVLRGGPHGRSARSGLEGHQRRAEAAPAEEEVAGGGQLGHDLETPVELVLDLLHAQESPRVGHREGAEPACPRNTAP